MANLPEASTLSEASPLSEANTASKTNATIKAPSDRFDAENKGKTRSITTSDARARRLLRALKLPAQASKILTHSRYHNESFYLHYEEACEDKLFTEPHIGLAMARFTPSLARLVDPETCRGATLDIRARRKEELMMRSLCILAGAYRRVGNLARAEALYRQAAEITGVSSLEAANLDRRLAVLRLDQGRTEEALTLVNGTLAVYRHQSPDLFAAALLVRGAIFLEADRYSEAVLDNSAALPHLNTKKHPRRFHMALSNISLALARGASYPEDLGQAIRYLKEANRLLRHQKLSLPKLKLKWIQGIILNKLGSTRRGETLLDAARQGLIKLRAPYEIAMVSLDLSALYLRQGRYWKLSEVADETFQVCRNFELTNTVLYAIQLWQQAAQAEVLTIELISVTRDTIFRHSRA